jgi:hypothetical protein
MNWPHTIYIYCQVPSWNAIHMKMYQVENVVCITLMRVEYNVADTVKHKLGNWFTVFERG